jgi:hypothetical protein
MTRYFAVKLVKLSNKNNKLMLIFGWFGVMLGAVENSHDRGNQTASEAVGRAEGAKAAPAEPSGRHRESRPVGQQPRPAATDIAGPEAA